MQTTNDLLDAVKSRYGLASDYALAKKIGMSRERISKYRHTGGALADENAVLVAELLDLPPGYVLACAAFERAKSDVSRSAWSHAADVLKRFGAAAAVLLSVVAPVHLLPTEAEANQTFIAQQQGGMYITFNLWYALFKRCFAGFFTPLRNATMRAF